MTELQTEEPPSRLEDSVSFTQGPGVVQVYSLTFEHFYINFSPDSAPLNPSTKKAIDKQPSNPHRIPGILPKYTLNQKQRCISERTWEYLQRSWCRKRLCKRGKSRLRKEDFGRRLASTLDGLTSARPNLCKKKKSLVVLKKSFGFKSRWKITCKNRPLVYKYIQEKTLFGPQGSNNCDCFILILKYLALSCPTSSMDWFISQQVMCPKVSSDSSLLAWWTYKNIRTYSIFEITLTRAGTQLIENHAKLETIKVFFS